VTRISEDQPQTFRVVRNEEDQYSVWSADRDVPSGWRDVDVTGSQEECLAHIARVWQDIRPKSLVSRMAAAPDRKD